MDILWKSILRKTFRPLPGFIKQGSPFRTTVKMSLFDETSSDLPVKDTDCRPAVIAAIQDVAKAARCQSHLSKKTPKLKEKDLKARRRVCLISREELEDNFLRLHEENLILKDYARKQEDKIKRMATKLLRLTSDLGKPGEKKAPGARRDGRDLEAEEMIEDLQERVRDLERRNEALRHRLTTYKHRLQFQNGCRHCPYSTVTARTDSGVRKAIVLPDKYKKGLVVQGPDFGHPHMAGDFYGEALSDEARADIDRLFQIIGRQASSGDDRSTALLKTMVKPKELGAEMILSLHQMQQVEDQRTTIQENVTNIRLQKELREKSTSLCALREQFQQLKESYETELQEKQKSLILSHNAVLIQLENLSSQLKDERGKVLAMEIDQQNIAHLQKSLLEFQERVSDLEKEKELLKENYENLLKSSLDTENMNSWKVTEVELKAQIKMLEGQIQCHVIDLTQSKELLRQEKEQNEHLKEVVSQLQSQLLEKMQEIHNLQDKVSDLLILTTTKHGFKEEDMKRQKAQPTNVENIQKATERNVRDQNDLWDDRKEKTGEKSNQRQFDLVSNMGSADVQREEKERTDMEEKEKRRKRRMREMEADLAETILELQKTREMLCLQHKINNDYQEELKTVKLRLECESRENEEKVRHYETRLLQRNSRVQMLEAQLKDIAYGTFPFRLNTEESPSSEVEISPSPSLHRGETLFEVHIEEICFTPYGMRMIGDPQPITFCIYSLYDFETHATPVVAGVRPHYNFTSRYAVTPDPEFLRYLRVGTLTLELYQVKGVDHYELARGRLKLESALQTTDRVHDSTILTDEAGETIAELSYWLRLHGPLSHVQCLQRQRNKAHGYLSTRRHGNTEKFWKSPLNSGLQNELIIKIWGCRSLKASYLGHQPSPYIVYRFYHYPDHTTSIIPCSNNPQFGYEAVYPLQMTIELERYLQQERLCIYVFDDEETQSGVYLGKAEVPLLRLAQGNSIQGDFGLMNPHGMCVGSVQINLEWKTPYHEPGQSLWESSISGGNITSEKVQEYSLPQHQSPRKMLLKEASRINLNSSGPSKSRKAEEELQRDVSANKRGRRDPYSTDNLERFKQQKEARCSPSTPHHQSDEMDMNVEDILIGPEVKQDGHEEEINESDQQTIYVNSFKPVRQVLPKGNTSNSLDESLITDSDDDDDIVIAPEPLLTYKLSSSRMRVEVASLTLDPCSHVATDKSVERVFVEFHFPGVPPEETETPLSLRKPINGEEIFYHFSKVIHLAGENHVERRRFLNMLLQGSDSAGERVRLTFTVVSDPMNEEEDECRDLGYAYLDLRNLLRRDVEPAEETLQVSNVTDPREIIGTLRVVIEAREAARAVYRERKMKSRVQ
ncbi:X-linked retinitis pigmentosa GTPase regulator-interacting protein 1 [Bufo gargarizans]|uniref:X-linked retinitis pigmentosa GTPase regulator-interacting protein 1 n=1 Tax=Bufo gargarizans TaxID=30331 RepID=UPI001CF1628C|nr:X-linked retinitis pigmentosa GTPase regulator-interacting protein 1 [Bufo gargarizans]